MRKMSHGSSFGAGELDDILRFGTARLFAEDGASREGERIAWDDAAVDRLLDRSTADGGAEVGATVGPGQPPGAEVVAGAAAPGLLSGFHVAEYTTVEEGADATDPSGSRAGESAEADEPDYWKKLLFSRWEAHQSGDDPSVLGRGRRNRGEAPDYRQDKQRLYLEVHDESERSSKRARAEETWTPPPLVSWDAEPPGAYRICGFNESERAVFRRALMRHGLGGLFAGCRNEAELAGKRREEIAAYTNRRARRLCVGGVRRRRPASGRMPSRDRPPRLCAASVPSHVPRLGAGTCHICSRPRSASSPAAPASATARRRRTPPRGSNSLTGARGGIERCATRRPCCAGAP